MILNLSGTKLQFLAELFRRIVADDEFYNVVPIVTNQELAFVRKIPRNGVTNLIQSVGNLLSQVQLRSVNDSIYKMTANVTVGHLIRCHTACSSVGSTASSSMTSLTVLHKAQFTTDLRSLEPPAVNGNTITWLSIRIKKIFCIFISNTHSPFPFVSSL